MVNADWTLQETTFLVAGIFALLSTVVTMYLIYKHLRNFSGGKLQVRVVRVLLMVPIYAILSWLSLRFRDAAIYFDLVRDTYEAYTLFQFYMLLESFLAKNLRESFSSVKAREEELDDQQLASMKEFQARMTRLDKRVASDFEVVAALLASKPAAHHPWPFKKFTFQPGRRFLYWTRFCILQFALQKPLNTLISLILEVSCKCFHEGSFSPDAGYLYLMILDNLSITTALYFLVLFYETTVEQLKPIRPLPKFISIKAVIFFSFWQGVGIALLTKLDVIEAMGAWSKEEVSTGLQDFLIVIEMFIISVAHHFVFTYQEYHIPNKEPFVRGILRGHAASHLSPLLANMREVVNPDHDLDVTKETILDPLDKRFRPKPRVRETKAEAMSVIADISESDHVDLP